MRRALLLELPQIAYGDALDLQRTCVSARKTGKLQQDLILLLEHLPVFTLGRHGGRENLLLSETALQERGIGVVPIERGGNITYHGPGQLVVYFIMDLRAAGLSVTDLVTGMETVMTATAAHWGINATGNAAFRGAWVENRKLGSIGVTIRHGISFHGLALNVNTDLSPFSWINPCGIQGCAMTSLAKETHGQVDQRQARSQLKAQISKVFELDLAPIGQDQLISSLSEDPTVP